jgi:undecaprenyl-diphosphatase
MSAWILRIAEFDLLALRALVTRRTPWLDAAMRALTHLGGAPFMIAAAITLLFLSGPQLTDESTVSAFALATSHALVQLLKRTVARPRPSLAPGIISLITAPDRFSFPSGHSAATLSLALPLATTLGALPGAILLALAMAVGLSRCYLGVHYPGDVLTGWILAVGTVLAAPACLSLTGVLH